MHFYVSAHSSLVCFCRDMKEKYSHCFINEFVSNFLRSMYCMVYDMYVFSANCPVTYVRIRQSLWDVFYSSKL